MSRGKFALTLVVAAIVVVFCWYVVGGVSNAFNGVANKLVHQNNNVVNALEGKR